MLIPGRAQKVTIYLNEDTTSTDNFLCDQVFKFLYDQGVAGAIVTRSQEGFGSRHTVHDRESKGAKGLHLPVRIEFVDSAEKVATILPALSELVTDGLIEMHEKTIVKMTRKEGSF